MFQLLGENRVESRDAHARGRRPEALASVSPHWRLVCEIRTELVDGSLCLGVYIMIRIIMIH